MQKTKRLALLGLLLLASVGSAVAAQASGVLGGFADEGEAVEIGDRVRTVVVPGVTFTPSVDTEKAKEIVLMDSWIQEFLDDADDYFIQVVDAIYVKNVYDGGKSVELGMKWGFAKVTIKITNDYGEEIGVQVIEAIVDMENEEITERYEVTSEVIKPKVKEGITPLSELMKNHSDYYDVIVTVSGKVSSLGEENYLLGEPFDSLFELDEMVTVIYSHDEATVDVSGIENGDTVTVTGKFWEPNLIYATKIEK
ncbi:MAG: hypothetical protein PVH73_08320 [Candidatus Bathyarchaeota archaeon]|jgi:hypothetical protein